MADKKISELNPLTGANSATGDLFVLVDVSTNETKRMTRAELIEALGQNFIDIIASGGIFLGGTAAANKLDDYEEGNYVATLAPETSGTITLTSLDDLAYTKVGRKVHVQGQIVVQSVSSPVGDWVTMNLPFPTATLAAGNSQRFGTVIPLFILGSWTTAILYNIGVTTSVNIRLDASQVANNTQFYIDFTYVAA